MDYIAGGVTNVEMALLEVIKEKSETTGYEIGQIIEKRGYRDWANIGKTSIYTGISKLKNKGFITVITLKKKEGKGPLPNIISLTKLGEKVLYEEIKNALLSQKNLPLYYLGIAGIRLLKKDVALQILKQREIINKKIIVEIGNIFERKGGERLPLEAKALFEHPILLIKSDNQFLINFINKLRGEMDGEN
jgi:DNA-binding PadR family transcriptional regulator